MTANKHNKYQHYTHAGLSYFGKIVDHSDYGEGFNAMSKHISEMSLFERMDFEDLELCGDKLLAPHDNTVDMPYYLTLEYLYKKTGEDLTLLKEYRDLLIELEADKATCTQFEAWIKIRGIEPAIEYLKMLVSELAACRPADDDYLYKQRENHRD
ncbi:MAG: hypothetical protein ACMUJM_25445 [bacterium]